MDKLKMHSPDLTAKEIRQIAKLLPNCCTESKGPDSSVRQPIAFDQLRQELSNYIVEGPAERYRLDWPGQREASNQSRLVAAYSMALADASLGFGGLHPGFVLLDEPLQQNPDGENRELLFNSLTNELSKLMFQLVIFTWLPPNDIERLRKAGIQVLEPSGRQFLRMTDGPSAGEDAGIDGGPIDSNEEASDQSSLFSEDDSL